MTSEVHHIITLSLNKIVASRHRKGGINLHRNLLVASVLLRAKDAYVAETVAKRKRDMDMEAVVPSFDTSSMDSTEEELPDAMEDMETDISSLSESNISCEEPTRDEVDESKSYECDTDDSEVDDEFQNNEFDSDKFYAEKVSRISDLEDDEDDCDNVTVIVDTEMVSKPPSRCSRKRRTFELDSPIVNCAIDSDIICDTNINENFGSCSSEKLEFSEDQPCSKYARLDIHVQADSNSYTTTDSDCDTTKVDHCNQQDSQLYTTTDVERKWDYSDDDEDDDITSNHAEHDNGSCYSSLYSSDNHTFTPRVGLSLSHSSMLIVTM